MGRSWWAGLFVWADVAAFVPEGGCAGTAADAFELVAGVGTDSDIAGGEAAVDLGFVRCWELGWEF